MGLIFTSPLLTFLDLEITPSNQLIGWRTDHFDLSALINTETTICSVLGLGANSLSVFESAKSLGYCQNCSFYVRPTYNAISAIAGSSSTGYLSFGPGLSLYELVSASSSNANLSQSYTVSFYLRIPANYAPQTGSIGVIDIYDAFTNREIAGELLFTTNFNTGNNWTEFNLTLITGLVKSPSQSQLQFRVFWNEGTVDLDFSFIRFREFIGTN